MNYWKLLKTSDGALDRRLPSSSIGPSFPVENIDFLSRKNNAPEGAKSAKRREKKKLPKRMCLELAEAPQMDREFGNFSESGGNCAQEKFGGNLDSQRVKLTAICMAVIPTLPRISFPDNNFVSCLFVSNLNTCLNVF